MKKIMKEISKITKLFDDHVVIEVIDDNLKNLKLTLYVPDGIHAGATYEFRTHGYHSIVCLTPIHHPNIKDGEAVCCNILGGDEWHEDAKLSSIIAALYCLINTPNFDEPLWDEGDDYEEDDYDDNVRTHLIANNNYNPIEKNDMSEE